MHFVCFSLRHIDHIVQTFVKSCNEQRPHRGIGNRPLDRLSAVQLKNEEWVNPIDQIGCRSELGGLL